jgi:putative endonuclease
MYFVYILESLSTGALYVGQTDNLLRRYGEHASGENKSTRGRGPWWIPYFEVLPTRDSAVAREHQMKAWKSAKVLRSLIQQASDCVE